MNPLAWWRARQETRETERRNQLDTAKRLLAQRYEVRVVFSVTTRLSDHVEVIGPVGHPYSGGSRFPCFWHSARGRAYERAAGVAKKGIWLTERQLIAPALIATVFVRQLPDVTEP